MPRLTTRPSHISVRKAAPYAAIAVLAGIVIVIWASAANTLGFELEAGTLGSGATKVSMSEASGGSVVRFAAPTPLPTASPACGLNASTATLASQISAATTGQVICLDAGNYGTWAGTNKSVTLKAQPGVVASMELNLGLGDANFTLDGLRITGGVVYGNRNNYASADRPQNITIKNSTFTGAIDISYVSNANILLDRNTHNDISVNSTCTSSPARIWISGESTVPSGVTVSNSLLSGGNADGIQAGLPSTIVGNEFANIQEKSSSDCAHTDAIQLYGGTGMVIRGNYIHDSADGIVAYDGTSNNLIEDNVIDLRNGRFGIEMYSDKNSTLRHNTLVYGTGCNFAPCGGIYLDHKSVDPAGSGTIVENNIATSIELANGSTASVNRNNLLRTGASGSNIAGSPTYVGGSTLASYAAYKLAAGSAGKGRATDGADVGIR